MRHSTSIAYRPDLDGLRAIAVLAVVGFHAFPTGLRGGFVGVDIFFVISGFLISLDRLHARRARLLQHRGVLRSPRPPDLSGAHPRLAASLVVRIPCAARRRVRTARKARCRRCRLPAELHAVEGERLLRQRSADEAPAAPWCLAVEEQFYLFWPLLLAFVWKRRWSRWARRSPSPRCRSSRTWASSTAARRRRSTCPSRASGSS